jgi:hypothetical protein
MEVRNANGPPGGLEARKEVFGTVAATTLPGKFAFARTSLLEAFSELGPPDHRKTNAPPYKWRCQLINVLSLSDITEPAKGSRQLFIFDHLLDDQHLCAVCPSASFVTIAELPAHRLVVNSDGLVAAVPSRDSTVHGIVVEVPETETSALATRLAVHGLDDCRRGFAVDFLGDVFPVEFWTSTNHREGRAEAIEIVRLLALARQFRFPDSYLAEIAHWAKGPDEVPSDHLRPVS